MTLRSMNTAPMDGTEIVIKVRGRGFRRVYYVDCSWLREEDPEVTDCWRTSYERSLAQDIELEDAEGWRPAV